jgi:hypothetical protein
MIEALMMPHLILLGCVDMDDLPDEVKPLPLLKDQRLMGPMVGHGRGSVDMAWNIRPLGRL